MSSARALLRDAVLGTAYLAGATAPRRALRDRLAIVTFHRVLPEELAREYPIDGLAATPAELAGILGFFSEHFTCATLREASRRFAAGERPARPWLAVTFDDGQRDNVEHAAPVLARLGVSATFFATVSGTVSGAALWHDRLAYAVARGAAREPAAARALVAAIGAPVGLPARALVRCALDHAKRLPHAARGAFVEAWEGRLGGPARPSWDGMMDAAQLRALAVAGHEIGAHSWSHPILPGCSAEELERETGGAREALRAMSGDAVDSFCYPNGDHDARVRAAVRRAGYVRAVTTRWGPNDASTDPLALRRCDIQGQTSRSARGTLSPARLAWRVAGHSAPRSG